MATRRVSFSALRAAAWMVVGALGACGGSGGGGGGGGGGGVTPVNLTNFQVASDIIGQTAANGGNPNNGGATNQVGLAGPFGPVANGSLYVADPANNRVMGWASIPTGLGQPADFVLGQADFLSFAPGTTAGKFHTPTACCVTSNTLFVADQENHRVLIFSPPPTGSASASVALGQPNLTTVAAGLGQAALNEPVDVCVAANRIVVADATNHRVMVWNGVPGTSGANAQIVLGQPDFTTNSFAGTASKMHNPTGVWTDGTRLAVADALNNRVLIWTTFPTANGQAPDLVVGQPDLTTITPGITAQKFNVPAGVTSDGLNLFVADRGNHRVLVFSPFPTASNPVASVVLGQSNFTNNASNDDDQDSVTDAPSARNFFRPSGLHVIGTKLFVSDTSNNRVLIFTGS